METVRRRTLIASLTVPIAVSAVFIGTGPDALASGSAGTDPTHVTRGTAANRAVRVTTDGDSYTSSAYPGTGYGSAADVRVGSGSGSTKTAYVHFTVPSADVGKVTSAALVLTRTAHHLPSTTISARSVTGSWNESALTAATAPATGATLGTRPVSAASNSVTFDVTSAVKGKPAASFALTSPITTDVAIFNSRESGAAAPALVLKISNDVPVTGGGGKCAVTTNMVSTCQVWLGDAPEAHALNYSPTSSKLATDESFSGRKFDIVHDYSTNGQLFPNADLLNLTAQGRTLLENWKPSTSLTWAAVAAGKADATIDAEAAYLRSHVTRPFFLTIYHEPEDNVNASSGSGMTTADYVAMYRHTVARLHADGATMFRTVMNYMGYYHWDSMRDALYPGDDVVDWIAWDPYMHYPSNKTGGDFASLVNTAHGSSPGFYSWATSKHPGKPLMLAEWGVYDDHLSGNPMGPAQFYGSVATELSRFPALKALVYFTMNPKDVPAGGATSPTITAPGLSAWRTLAQNPMLNSATAAAGRYRSATLAH